MKRLVCVSSILLCATFAFYSCGGGGESGTKDNTGGGNTGPVDTSNMWTWVAGSNEINTAAVFGTKGTANPANNPGGFSGSVVGTDSSGNVWIFGGKKSGVQYLNTLWKFDGTNWTWVSGSDTINQPGVYGTKGVADSENCPGSRYEGLCWIDSSGNIWIFGGYGYDSAGTLGNLNDLWKFDGTNWTWISGSDTINQPGVYGTKGVADPGNYPGTRRQSTGFMDSSGNFWLFGGYGCDSTTYAIDNNVDLYLNDLWKFDGTNWTWVSGSEFRNINGVYGTKGVADAANYPGSRRNCVGWLDSSGNIWIFGGYGYDDFITNHNPDALNDLWKFDGTNWTWVKGSNENYTEDTVRGVYGEMGVAAADNTPVQRQGSIGWLDSSDNLWLFGGVLGGRYNDLWKFDGTNWTWMSGSSSTNQTGTYGEMGTAASDNMPGARYGSVSWIDSSGNLYFYGGYGYAETTSLGCLGDMWKYEP